MDEASFIPERSFALIPHQDLNEQPYACQTPPVVLSRSYPLLSLESGDCAWLGSWTIRNPRLLGWTRGGLTAKVGERGGVFHGLFDKHSADDLRGRADKAVRINMRAGDVVFRFAIRPLRNTPRKLPP